MKLDVNMESLEYSRSKIWVETQILFKAESYSGFFLLSIKIGNSSSLK